MQTNLIEIKTVNGANSVSARELHEKLGVKTFYKDWFNRMKEYGFEENKDFVLVAQKRATNNPKNPTTTYTEHFISLDMAKEICMIQRTEIGRKFRRYFIDCEKQLMTGGSGYALACKIAGGDGKALEYVSKWKILEHRPHLTVKQVNTICRLLPIAELTCSDVAKVAGTTLDTIYKIRSQILRMQKEV